MIAGRVALVGAAWALAVVALSAGCNALVGTTDITYADAGAADSGADAEGGAHDDSAREPLVPCDFVAGLIAGEPGASCPSANETWQCGSAQISIVCTCPSAACTCGDRSFPHDCRGGCEPTLEDYHRCGMEPRSDPDAGAGTGDAGDAAPE